MKSLAVCEEPTQVASGERFELGVDAMQDPLARPSSAEANHAGSGADPVEASSGGDELEGEQATLLAGGEAERRVEGQVVGQLGVVEARPVEGGQLGERVGELLPELAGDVAEQDARVAGPGADESAGQGHGRGSARVSSEGQNDTLAGLGKKGCVLRKGLGLGFDVGPRDVRQLRPFAQGPRQTIERLAVAAALCPRSDEGEIDGRLARRKLGPRPEPGSHGPNLDLASAIANSRRKGSAVSLDLSHLRWYARYVGASDDLTLLDELVGQSCWSAAAGLDREWLVVLDLGERVRRSLRLANPTLNFQQRTYEGSHAVVVEGTWRVDGPEQVIVSCLDTRQPTDRLQAGLQELEGRTVIGVDAAGPAHDLTLRFEGDFALRVFVLEPLPQPDVSVPEGQRPPPPPKPPRSCWTVFTPSGSVRVGPHGRLGDPRAPEPPSPKSPPPALSLVDDDGHVR